MTIYWERYRREAKEKRLNSLERFARDLGSRSRSHRNHGNVTHDAAGFVLESLSNALAKTVDDLRARE
jgi:hypothetical protein